ncbi:MAG: hypothetical protein ACYC35_22035 [Pirellulales bacterium]
MVERYEENIKRQFQWAVQALAQPPNVQPTLFPPFVVVADELALEFDNWWKAYESNFGHLCSQQQREAVSAVDHLLAEMSGPDKPELWLDDGCLNHPKWSEVRRLAADVLSAFEWPPGLPPLGRVTYVRYSPEAESGEAHRNAEAKGVTWDAGQLGSPG